MSVTRKTGTNRLASPFFKSKPKFEEAIIELEYSILKLFSEYVEKYLRAWNFPGLSTVEFDRTHKVFDLIISNRGRNSHGKGVRAISYSAFIFGLLDYCIEKSKPHSGFIVLDSPLTTYHNNQKPQIGDEVSLDMQDAFFKDLTQINENRQIIILDNKMPNENLVNDFNLIKFSNDGNRKGFFPS